LGFGFGSDFFVDSEALGSDDLAFFKDMSSVSGGRLFQEALPSRRSNWMKDTSSPTSNYWNMAD
jgi:hypothetical protein